MNYTINPFFSIDCGFVINSNHIVEAINQTNSTLGSLPPILYKSIDYKTTSAIIGAIFCDKLANLTDGIVNPIEKGHPDIIPVEGKDCTEKELHNYPEGLEVKCTVGNITKGAHLKAGETRVDFLTGITWQAHHREVNELLGLVWDFLDNKDNFNFPVITAAFYANNLVADDWGKISGTSGRNTKVTGIRTSGKEKMGKGWIAIINKTPYVDVYQNILKFNMT
jgi:hypothetical protein